MSTMQITNTSGGKLNDVQKLTTMPSSVVDSIAGITATGGSRNNPLPFPFEHVAEMAAAAVSAALPIHAGDLLRSKTPYSPLPVRIQWQQMIQAKKVTVAFAGAAQADVSDSLMGTF